MLSSKQLTPELTVHKIHLPDNVVFLIRSWCRPRVESINFAIRPRQLTLKPVDFVLQPTTDPDYISRLSSWARSLSRLGGSYGINSYSRILQARHKTKIL